MSGSSRRTRQGTALRRAFRAAGRPLAPREALELGQEEVPDLSLATVYRWIKRHVEDGDLAVVELPGEPPRYEPAEVAAHHHHHFHCRGCGRVFDLEGCSGGIERLAPRGFQVEDHNLVLYGTCAACGG